MRPTGGIGPERMRRLLPAALAAVALAACTSEAPTPNEPVSPAPASQGPSDGPWTGEQLTDRVFAHLEAFQRIADGNAGTRAHDTSGYDASLDYAEQSLARAGFTTSRHTSEAVVEENSTAAVRVVQGQQVDLGTVEPMTRTPGGEATAPLALTTDPLGCTLDDYVAARGAIVLVQRGRCPFTDKSALAHEAGALALIVYNSPGQGDLRGELADRDDLVPSVGVSDAVGEALEAAVAGGGIVVQVRVEESRETIQVTNLIADWPGEGDGDVVLLGAHLDSVPAGPGINDNASGVSLALTLAERLAAEGEADGLRVAFWGAEELGLVGSGAYVKSLSQEEVARIAGYVNLDMVASTNGLIGLYGAGAPFEAFSAELERHDIDFQVLSITGASDHAWFESLNIGVAGFYTGAGEPLAADEAQRFGGTSDAPRDRCYHQACDTVDEVSTTQVRDRLSDIATASLDGMRVLLGETRG